MTDLKEIFSEWTSNLQFREDFKKNPVEALKTAGFEVSAQDLSKIESLLKLKDSPSKSEELDKRISK